MPRLLEAHPGLRIVCEHLTTKDAVEFVQETPDCVAGTITPQHLLYTMGDLIQGLKYHLYCLPVVKFEADRDSLRAAIVDMDQHKFSRGRTALLTRRKQLRLAVPPGVLQGDVLPNSTRWRLRRRAPIFRWRKASVHLGRFYVRTDRFITGFRRRVSNLR